MRRVKKRTHPPPCLAERRREIERQERSAGTRLEDRWGEVSDCKADLRDAIWSDQRGLCAYCGGSMPNDVHMKIEHFVPRSEDPEKILEWSNLLGCCGGEYRDARGQVVRHCDSSRTPKVLLRTHPVESPTEPATLFRVNVTARGAKLGEIEPSTADAEHDLRELNLNATKLRERRAGVIEELRQELGKLGSDARVRRFIRRRLKTLEDASGPLPPYAHVTLAYLERKRRAHDV